MGLLCILTIYIFLCIVLPVSRRCTHNRLFYESHPNKQMKFDYRVALALILVIIIGFAACNESNAQTVNCTNYQAVYTALVNDNNHLLLPGQTRPDSVYFGQRIDVPNSVARCVGAPAAFSFIVGRGMPQGISGIASAIANNQFHPFIQQGQSVARHDTLQVIFSGIPEQTTVVSDNEIGWLEGILRALGIIALILLIVYLIAIMRPNSLTRQAYQAQQDTIRKENQARRDTHTIELIREHMHPVRFSAKSAKDFQFQMGVFPDDEAVHTHTSSYHSTVINVVDNKETGNDGDEEPAAATP